MYMYIYIYIHIQTCIRSFNYVFQININSIMESLEEGPETPVKMVVMVRSRYGYLSKHRFARRYCERCKS